MDINRSSSPQLPIMDDCDLPPSNEETYFSTDNELSYNEATIDISCNITYDMFYRSVVLRLPSGMTEDQLDEELVMQAENIGLRQGIATHPVRREGPSISIAQMRLAGLAATIAGPFSSVLSDGVPSLSLSYEPSSPTKSSVYTTSSTSSLSKLRAKCTKLSAFRKGKLPASLGSSLNSLKETVDISAPPIQTVSPWKKKAFTHSRPLLVQADTDSSIRSTSPHTPLTTPFTPQSDTLPSEYEESSLFLKEFIGCDDPVTSQRDPESRAMIELKVVLKREHTELNKLECSFRRLLDKKYEHDLLKMSIEEEKKRKELIERNETAISKLEERHYDAEVELVEELKWDKKACRASIRYMEGYCHSPTQLPDQPPRSPSSVDWQRLANQHHFRDTMEVSQQGKISSLRERQILEKKDLQTRQKQQHEQLLTYFHMRRANLKTELCKKYEGLQGFFTAKRERILQRAIVRQAILRKKMDPATVIQESSKLPQLDFVQPPLSPEK
ncbi:MAG: hypothetical protein M1834_003479 [Cirrosporium novae-zelandiae]|nr:MAG: hypothetical protein M1834_003479 [Cirrosporium novae-zelandiae]